MAGRPEKIQLELAFLEAGRGEAPQARGELGANDRRPRPVHAWLDRVHRLLRDSFRVARSGLAVPATSASVFLETKEARTAALRSTADPEGGNGPSGSNPWEPQRTPADKLQPHTELCVP